MWDDVLNNFNRSCLASEVGSEQLVFMGELAPGPDYKLYLSPEFVETEADFERLKSNMVLLIRIDAITNSYDQL